MLADVRSRSRRLHAVGLITVAICAPAVSAGAQLVSTLDVGASSMRHDGISSTAMSLTPALQYERGGASLFAFGSLARYETSVIGANGAAAASFLSSPVRALRGLRAELALDGAASTIEGAPTTGRLAVHGRGHLARATTGLWLGAGAGRGWDGDSARTLTSVEAGGWWRRRGVLVSASIAPFRAGGASWTDVTGTARWTSGIVELAGTAGLRAGDEAVDAGTWGGVDGLLWLTRHIALSASAGRYRADPVQGITAGRYLTFGVRLASRPPLLDLQRVRSTMPAPELVRPVAGSLSVRGAGEQRTIRIEAPGAHRVEIMGDFTAWQIVPLDSRRGSSWEVTLPLAAGSHRFNVRVDGGDWGVPDGVTAITDDFGGVAGILIVR